MRIRRTTTPPKIISSTTTIGPSCRKISIAHPAIASSRPSDPKHGTLMRCTLGIPTLPVPQPPVIAASGVESLGGHYSRDCPQSPQSGPGKGKSSAPRLGIHMPISKEKALSQNLSQPKRAKALTQVTARVNIKVTLRVRAKARVSLRVSVLQSFAATARIPTIPGSSVKMRSIGHSPIGSLLISLTMITGVKSVEKEMSPDRCRTCLRHHSPHARSPNKIMSGGFWMQEHQGQLSMNEPSTSTKSSANVP